MVRSRPAHDLSFPHWMPIVAALLVLAPALVAVAQRSALFPPAWPAAAAALAMLPWLAEMTVAILHLRRGSTGDEGKAGREPGIELSLPLFNALAIGGVGLMLLRPVEVDAAPFILVFLAGEMAARTTLRAAITVAAACSVVLTAAEVAGLFDASLIWTLGIAIGVFAGLAMRTQMRLVEELKAREVDVAERAAAEERQRIAREVHDVVAHSLAVVMLHLTAARRALERGTPDAGEAVDVLREAERLGRQSMSDIRSTIGMLGPGNGGALSLPGAGDVPALVESFRVSGRDVRLRVSGTLEDVDPATGLAVYRAAQEALSNAAKHAPDAAVDVRVDVDAAAVAVSVRNPLPASVSTAGRSAPGHGLRGMAERVGLLEGAVSAGPESGSWVVDVRIPRRRG